MYAAHRVSRALLLGWVFSAVLLTACRTTDVPAPVASPAVGAPVEAAVEAPQQAETAVDAAEPDPPVEEYSNKIRWKTASELDNFGYDVFRGESSDGPFERLNLEVIEGAGTTDEPTAYEYVDRTIDPYKTYYYYVESISMDGVREKFTPVGKAAAKISQGSEEGGE